MLLGNLYEILSSEMTGPHGGIVTARILPDSPIFMGHFPSHPITPGVCLVEMARECCAQLLGIALPDIRRAKDIRFNSPVIPTPSTILCIEASLEGDSLRCSIREAEKPICKMDLNI